VDKIVVFNRINSSKQLTLKVYNVASEEEIDDGSFPLLIKTIQKLSKNYGIKVSVSATSSSYFKDFKNPTIVIEDEYSGENFDLEVYSNKVSLLQESLVFETFDVESKV